MGHFKSGRKIVGCKMRVKIKLEAARKSAKSAGKSETILKNLYNSVLSKYIVKEIFYRILHIR